jgi:Gas vesicle protein
MRARDAVARRREVALVDLVDRLLAGGVVIGGDLTLSIADVDLVHVGLRAIVASVATEEGAPASDSGRPAENGGPRAPERVSWAREPGPRTSGATPRSEETATAAPSRAGEALR